MFRSENSSVKCSDQRTVQINVQIVKQFRYMKRSENNSERMEAFSEN